MKKLWIIFEMNNRQEEFLTPIAKKQKLDFETKYAEYFSIENGKLFYEKKEISEFPDVVLLRCWIGVELELHKIFSNLNIRVIDNDFCLATCNDKLATHETLGKHGIKQPVTLTFKKIVSYDEVKKTLGNKFIIKDRFGQEGKQVFLISNEKEFEDAIKQSEWNNIIFQEFIEESTGKDLRAYVIGGKIAGAILRINNNGFKSNISETGAKPYKHQLTKEQVECALKIAQILQGEIISVDFLLKNDELYFCEANTNAGFYPFENVGILIGQKIIDYVHNILIE